MSRVEPATSGRLEMDEQAHFLQRLRCKRKKRKKFEWSCVHCASVIVILFACLPGEASSQRDDVAGDISKSQLFIQSQAKSMEEPLEVGAQLGALSGAQLEKRTFVMELLRELHEQYGSGSSADELLLEERRSSGGAPASRLEARMMPQLLEAIGAEGDARRLIDWIKDSFNPASLAELSTQFVVSKLGAVNCPALLPADKEESLVPRFLLFNEHHVDVPYELPIEASESDCSASKFDPARKTLVIVHGYLGGYTLIDGLTNIKNRLLDLNAIVHEQALGVFMRAARTQQNANTNATSSYVFTDDLSAKIRGQLYNVLIVDWFTGANPRPRANYIRAAVNAQVVGKLIARFLSALVTKCRTRAEQIQMLAHSLGCHVSGFTGKAMNAAGHKLGKITHLDPVGLCFGRLFSQRRFRLSADDALETQAVHVSLNVFDNPLDGAHSNFLVNGGRDQPGCGNQNEIKNSTVSSVSLLFDPAARFAPCSHLRALALFEDDHSSAPGQCQLVGYRCPSYERFLAGKCALCDAANSQCRLMGLAPLALKLRTMPLASYHYDALPEPPDEHSASHNWRHLHEASDTSGARSTFVNSTGEHLAASSSSNVQTFAANFSTDTQLNSQTSAVGEFDAAPSTTMFGRPAYSVGGGPQIRRRRRAERHLAAEKRERISQVIERLRSDTRLAWTNLRAQTEASQEPEVGENSKLESAREFDDNQLDDGQAELASESHSSSTRSMPKTISASNSDTLSTSRRPQTSVKLEATAEHREHEDGPDQVPVGGQPIPADSLNGPLFYLGTSSMTPFCVNYYQVRVLFAESRLLRAASRNGLASNRLRAQYSLQPASLLKAAAGSASQPDQSSGRDMLHLTIKLTDSLGHFFKGFSLLESVRALSRTPADLMAPGLNEPLLELTMLLNSTRAQPVKVAESIVSFYFHPIVLADRLEVNYMSNISPDIRARYSSLLCPVAINDRHQLVKYIECHKVSRRRRRSV